MTIATRPSRPSRSGARRGAPRQGAPEPGSRSRLGVVGEIAERRRIDLEIELAADKGSHADPGSWAERVAAASPPRPIATRLAAPGLHVIAEIKRASPSAGRIAAAREDIVARARAYERGGAAAISVLCERHAFGGSIDDLVAIRAAVSVPVLAKDFVVDSRQLALLRAAGADLVLLLAVLHPRRRLSMLVDRALDLGLEPLVEAHDARELDAALATRARLIGVNNRDLRTLEVDVERAVKLRSSIPDDRIAIAESGVRDAATIRDWRAAGFDAALVGEALVRAVDPEAATRAFVAAGRPPDDAVELERAPFVKICGVTDEAGVRAVVSAGADALGLNLVPGTPRGLELGEAAALARLARSIAPADRPIQVVAITADRSAADLDEIAGVLAPDAIQLSGDEPVAAIDAMPRPAWKVLHVPAEGAESSERIEGMAARVVAEAREYLAAGAARILLDTAGGTHQGGTGRRASPGLVAAIALSLIHHLTLPTIA
jgi:indole-3-glycerol phosphate synthase/phosphoribosylanthranilate isomerase